MQPSVLRGLGRRATIVALLALGVAALGTSALTWVRSRGSTALAADVDIVVTGSVAAPGAAAAALVVVASALALGLGGRVGRWVVLGVAVVSGGVVGVSALSVALDPVPVARTGAAATTGVAELTGRVEVTAAVWGTVVLGALVVAVAGCAAVGVRGWQRATTRHDVPGRGGTGVPPAAGVATSPATSATSPDVAPSQDTPSDAVASGRPDGAPDERLDDHDAWDALTRGEDPTVD